MIGEGSAVFTSTVPSYTLCTLSATYSYALTPDAMQIVFSTSTPCSENSNQLNTPPGKGANEGTALWIDEISVPGGTLSVDRVAQKEISAFPNPAASDEDIRIVVRLEENTSKMFSQQRGNCFFHTPQIRATLYLIVENPFRNVFLYAK